MTRLPLCSRSQKKKLPADMLIGWQRPTHTHTQPHPSGKLRLRARDYRFPPFARVAVPVLRGKNVGEVDLHCAHVSVHVFSRFHFPSATKKKKKKEVEFLEFGPARPSRARLCLFTRGGWAAGRVLRGGQRAVKFNLGVNFTAWNSREENSHCITTAVGSPLSAVAMVTSGMTKYHRNAATLCLPPFSPGSIYSAVRRGGWTELITSLPIDWFPLPRPPTDYPSLRPAVARNCKFQLQKCATNCRLFLQRLLILFHFWGCCFVFFW